LQLLTGLQAYVKQYHTTGLAWNPKGGKFDGTSSHAIKPAIPPKPVAASAKAGPAPPPPPPPMPMFDYSDDANQKKGESAADIQARLKQELSVGMDITKSLKKVSDDQKTHKNPALRAGSTVPATSSSAAVSSAPSRPSSSATSAKPPKLELNDKKWCVVSRLFNIHTTCCANQT
jgi:adenylyl cyclase-associated protein